MVSRVSGRNQRQKTRILSLEQACRFLRVSRRTIARWVKQGLPCRVHGRERFFTVSGLRAWTRPRRRRPKKGG
ncbi:MAG: helix-turn-helix domain-containing protein [Candidatus Methylomirabilales bacterium]